MDSEVAKLIIRITEMTVERKARVLMRLLAEYPDDMNRMISQLETVDMLGGGREWRYSQPFHADINLPEADYDIMLMHVKAGRKVEAIKHVRMVSRSDLKAAKDAVEDLQGWREV